MKLTRPSIKFLRPITKRFRLIPFLSVLTVLVLLGSGVFWYVKVRNNPERIFWGMIENSLQTRSVTRFVGRDTNTNQPDQYLQYVTSPQQAVYGSNRYYQSGDTEESTLTTEVIGTPEADYLRVLELKQTMPGQPEPDLKDIKGVWANTTSDGFGGQLFSQAALNLVPIGSLNSADRAALLEQMRATNVYGNLNNVQKITYNKRPAYVYNIALNTEAYVRSLQTFAQKTGLKDLEDLNPDDYKGAEPLRLQVVVDITSKQLMQIRQLLNNQTTSFSGHGVHLPRITPPKDPITLMELQSRLQSLR